MISRQSFLVITMASMLLLLRLALFTVSQGSPILQKAVVADNLPKHPLLARDKCLKHVWRTDEKASLPGRCSGVNPLTDFKDEFKDVPVRDWMDCMALCCNLGTRCNVWQYQNTTQICYISKRPVRRGPEGADTALYCDPFATHSWNGKHKGIGKAATVLPDANGKCAWEYAIPRQCFAFGPERLKHAQTGTITMDRSLPGYSRMTTQECEAACCADPKCDSFQEYPGRGCYFGTSTCKYEAVELPYEGGRKCVPGFCGGKEFEQEILAGLPPEEMEKLHALVKWLKANPG